MQNHIMPPPQRSWKGDYWFHIVCSSVRLSVPPSVCEQNHVHSPTSTILAGSTSYLHILLSKFRRCVACIFFCAKFQNLYFWQFFQICNFDCVLFWLGIWYESIVLVIVGRREVFSERMRSSSSWNMQHNQLMQTFNCKFIYGKY